ncbi:MAG TPA: MFS transporter [Myxococcota bacterium]|nr:MFS transporter [Myxococcota bacterium]HPV04008.1 MFS transporter [Myxococcota bacterium]
MGDSGAINSKRLTRWQVQTFATLWGGYASYYLCRMNFSVAQPMILKDFPDWSSAEIGLIPTVYAFTYAIGQFVNGQLGEKFGARKMMTLAMSIAVITNLLFSQVSSLPLMLLLWAVNGYAQSAGWSLVIKTLTNWTTTRHRGLLVGLISTCYQVGNVASWLLAGYVAGTYGWRMAFMVPSIILAAMTVVLAVALRDDPRLVGFGRVRDDLGDDDSAHANTAAAIETEKLPFAETMRLVLSNKILWVLAIGYFCMNSVRYSFMNWAVTYMADFQGQAIKDSAFKAVALPLIGAIGAVSAGWMSDKLFHKRRAPLCAIMLFSLAVVCIGFILVPKGAAGIATAMLGLAGFLIYGPDMLMSGAATADVHPKAAAAATGFTMAMGNFGAMISGAGIGWLKDVTPTLTADLRSSLPAGVAAVFSEWTLIFILLAFLAILSAMLMVSIWNAKPKGAK